MKSRIIVFLVVFCLLPIQGFASKVTPSHVYQRTEFLRLVLEEHDLLDTQLYETIQSDEALRHPRHVMQKVWKCHTIFSKILKQKNIEVSPMPKLFSVREVRPSDVKNGVDHLIDEILKLGAVEIEEPVFVPARVPNDVYNNLKRICRAVRMEIIPSDVHQVARAVNDNLDKIAQARGYDTDVSVKEFQGKIPADVYKKTLDLLTELRLLALNPDFAIPGGVLIPAELSGKIEPQDVLTVMNESLAETNAIKYSLGIREHMTLPPYQEGKVPSDVFAQIERAHNIVLILLEKEDYK